MAKKKAKPPEAAKKAPTKSEFLRKALEKKPGLEYDQIVRRWTKAGHPGSISKPLYYHIRNQLGIKTVWTWGLAEPPPTRKSPQAKAFPKTDAGVVYEFKVTLQGTKPPIWRRIRLAGGTLNNLHEAIQTAMGWTNSHLHEFRIGEESYAAPMSMDMGDDFDSKDSTATPLESILPASGKLRFTYVYDFGDDWTHTVEFLGRSPAEPGSKYPICLAGARACPPDDCGGVWGYADLLEILANPEHPEYAERNEWLDGPFDPEQFDATIATRAMRAGLPGW